MVRAFWWAALVLAGCGHRVTHQVTVLDQHEVRLGERLAPPALVVRSDDDGVLLRVIRDPPCFALVQEQRLLRVVTRREARKGPVVVGAAVAAVGLLVMLMPGDDNGDAAFWPDPQTLGAAFIVGGTVAIASQPADSEDEHVRVVPQAPRETAAECNRADPEVSSVELILPDRRLLAAEPTPTGLWRVEVPWGELGRRVPVWVRVDGVTTHSITLVR